MSMSRANNAIKILRNLPNNNPKSDRNNINAQTKFGENPLMFFSSNHPETKYGRMEVQLTNERTDRYTDTQRETIILCKYREAGYKKGHKKKLPFLHSTLLLDLIYVPNKYYQIILNNMVVMVCTIFGIKEIST